MNFLGYVNIRWGLSFYVNRFNENLGLGFE